MSGRDEKKEQRRWQILEIALDQFVEKGFFGASTREICKLAGMSSGLMFHYFASKEELYEALAAIGRGQLELWQEAGGESPLRYFSAAAEELLQMIESSPFAAKMFVFMGDASHFASSVSPKAEEILSGCDLIKTSLPLIEKGQQIGQIRQGNPRALAESFWGALRGITKERVMTPGGDLPSADWILDIIKA